MMTGNELAAKAKEIAVNYKTIYVMGCFGAPMTESNKQRYYKHASYNNRADRKRLIQAADADTFGFDCVCLIKGILWGWSGDKSAVYGGAVYQSGGVPDFTDSIINASGSKDFSRIEVGEAVAMPGHIGVYIGDGFAVECTPAWDNGVQITAVGNIGVKAGYHTRTWTCHGKLPYVDYTAVKTAAKEENTVVITLPVLCRSARCSEVKTLQRLLNATIGTKLSIDGSFGPATDSAVRQYQKANGLAVDGSVGMATWTSLIK